MHISYVQIKVIFFVPSFVIELYKSFLKKSEDDNEESNWFFELVKSWDLKNHNKTFWKW